jgi:hypothetical protein
MIVSWIHQSLSIFFPVRSPTAISSAAAVVRPSPKLSV